MNLSFWEKDTFFNHLDIVIIGSGIVGLSGALAWRASHPNDKILVVDRGSLPSGASTKNAGFACFGSASELLDDLTKHSESFVFGLVEKRWKGLQKLRSFVPDGSMDFELSGNYELFRESDEALFQACIKKLPYLNEKLAPIIGVDPVFVLADHAIPRIGLKGISHLILNRAEGQLHTGKMMNGLINKAQKSDIRILNGIEVVSINDLGQTVEMTTAQGWTFKASKVLVATNGFTKSLFPETSVLPARNQVLVTTPIPGLTVKGCFHFDRGYVYFRNIGDRVLIGGGRNQAFEQETTDQFGFTQKIQAYLLDLLTSNIIPGKDFQIEQKWSGILGVGPAKEPILKKYSPNIALAVRLGGMGVAIGSLVGAEGAALLGND